MRIHARSRRALWFGPASATAPLNRFDDPLGKFRVCYLGTSIDVCFAETFLRNPPVRILALDDLAGTALAVVEIQAPLRLVRLHGPGLARLGATAEVAGGSRYDLAQSWSRALWEHPQKPDGILYRSRHDDSGFCVALYNRARSGLAFVEDMPLTADSRLLAKLLNRYSIGLTS